MARNKEFEEKVVLKKAMDLFWEQGYEKTSVQDLVNQMGIHRRSIYDTFRNKYELFLASLEYYESFVHQKFTEIIVNAPTTKDAIRNIFRYVLNSTELNDSPVGCLAVNTTTELSSIDSDIKKIVTEMFRDSERMFEELLEKGRLNGEFKEDINPQLTAQYLHNNLVGFRVLVKADYSKAEFERMLDLVLKVLD